MEKGDVGGITVPCPHLASTPHLSLCPKGSSPEPVPGAALRAWDSILSTELPSADAVWPGGGGAVNAELPHSSGSTGVFYTVSQATQWD